MPAPTYTFIRLIGTHHRWTGPTVAEVLCSTCGAAATCQKISIGAIVIAYCCPACKIELDDLLSDPEPPEEELHEQPLPPGPHSGFRAHEATVNPLSGEVTHYSDTDCDVDEGTGCCRTCGVEHGDPCEACGGRAFHARDCPENFAAAYDQERDDLEAERAAAEEEDHAEEERKDRRMREERRN